MGTDNLFYRQKAERKKRVSKKLKERSETWLVVCEGEKTEPTYFEKLFEYANSKSENKVRYCIDGKGRNTESLINSIDDYFSYFDDLVKKTDIPYGKIFAVFDKDSFRDDQFNKAIYRSLKYGYIPIWSNECIELWFLLHFSYLDTNVHRNEYFNKLSKIFKSEYKKMIIILKCLI